MSIWNASFRSQSIDAQAKRAEKAKQKFASDLFARIERLPLSSVKELLWKNQDNTELLSYIEEVRTKFSKHTPLQYALHKKRPEVSYEILLYTKDVAMRSMWHPKTGNLAIFAVKADFSQILDYVVRKGVDPYIENPKGFTALDLVLCKNNLSQKNFEQFEIIKQQARGFGIIQIQHNRNLFSAKKYTPYFCLLTYRKGYDDWHKYYPQTPKKPCLQLLIFSETKLVDEKFYDYHFAFMGQGYKKIRPCNYFLLNGATIYKDESTRFSKVALQPNQSYKLELTKDHPKKLRRFRNHATKQDGRSIVIEIMSSQQNFPFLQLLQSEIDCAPVLHSNDTMLPKYNNKQTSPYHIHLNNREQRSPSIDQRSTTPAFSIQESQSDIDQFSQTSGQILQFPNPDYNTKLPSDLGTPRTQPTAMETQSQFFDVHPSATTPPQSYTKSSGKYNSGPLGSFNSSGTPQFDPMTSGKEADTQKMQVHRSDDSLRQQARLRGDKGGKENVTNSKSFKSAPTELSIQKSDTAKLDRSNHASAPSMDLTAQTSMQPSSAPDDKSSSAQQFGQLKIKLRMEATKLMPFLPEASSDLTQQIQRLRAIFVEMVTFFRDTQEQEIQNMILINQKQDNQSETLQNLIKVQKEEIQHLKDEYLKIYQKIKQKDKDSTYILKDDDRSLLQREILNQIIDRRTYYRVQHNQVLESYTQRLQYLLRRMEEEGAPQQDPQAEAELEQLWDNQDIEVKDLEKMQEKEYQQQLLDLGRVIEELIEVKTTDNDGLLISRRKADIDQIQKSKAQELNLCVLCMDKSPVYGVLHGSGVHYCLCKNCKPAFEPAAGDKDAIKFCPICRQKIDKLVSVFPS